MDEERFCEILIDEGFPLRAIRGLWDSRFTVPRVMEQPEKYLSEKNLRATAKVLKSIGWIERWEKHEREEREKADAAKSNTGRG